MRFIRTKAALVAASLALTLAACGDAGRRRRGKPTSRPRRTPTRKFEDGTRMKELADAGKIKVGVKYDQPGLGFKGAADDIPSGFDVEIAKILVADLGIDPETRQGGRGRRPSPTTASPSCRPARSTWCWRRTRSPTSAAQLVGQTGPVHGDRPAGAGEVRQRHRVHRGPQGQGGLLGDRLDLAREDQGRGREGAPASTPTPSAPSRCSTAPSRRMSTDGSILLGFAAQNEGELKVVGEPFSEERIGVGYSKDAPRDVRVDQRRASRRRSTTAPGPTRSRRRSAQSGCGDAGAAGAGPLPADR